MTPVLAAVLLAAAACTGNALDNGSSPDVVIEVTTLENSPVTAQQAEGEGETGCTVEVVDWTATIENLPKNSLAGGESIPYNDVVMTSVIIEYYAYDDNDRVNLLFGPRVVGLGDVAIPAGGSNTVSFAPISFQDLLLNTTEGSTYNLVLTFQAATVEGTTIRATVERQLFIEACAGG
jgi:hypothetical protein